MKKTGRILLSLMTALAVVMTMGVTAFAAALNSGDEALQKALDNAKVKKSQVKRIEVEYDREDGVYEVEFTVKKNGKHCEYDISSDSGTIVKKSLEYKLKKNRSHKKIGKKAARKKVAKYSGVSYKNIKTGTCKYEYDDGKGVYEVKFSYKGRRYECDVLAPTGKIIEYEWKRIGK